MNMTNSQDNRQLVVWLDHDPQALEEVLSRITQLKRNQKDRRSLQDVFHFIRLIVPAGSDLISRAHDELLKSCGRLPDLLLVDLTFGSHESEAAVETGRDLASALAERLVSVPVGVYTRYRLSPLKRYH